MKKKFALVLSIVMMVFVLGACGTEPSDVDYNGYSAEDLKKQAFENAYCLDYLCSNIPEGQEISAEDLIGYGFTQAQVDNYARWGEVEKEFGECKEFASEQAVAEALKTEECDITKSGDTLTCDMSFTFGSREVTFQVVYSYHNMEMTGITVEPVYTIGEKMQKAGMNTLISISIVFCVLILISLIIYCFNIFAWIEKKNKEKQVKKAASDVTNDTVAEEVMEEVTDDTELIAVIAAAIAASSGQSTSDFVVRSINRR